MSQTPLIEANDRTAVYFFVGWNSLRWMSKTHHVKLLNAKSWHHANHATEKWTSVGFLWTTLQGTN